MYSIVVARTKLAVANIHQAHSDLLIVVKHLSLAIGPSVLLKHIEEHHQVGGLKSKWCLYGHISLKPVEGNIECISVFFVILTSSYSDFQHFFIQKLYLGAI